MPRRPCPPSPAVALGPCCMDNTLRRITQSGWLACASSCVAHWLCACLRWMHAQSHQLLSTRCVQPHSVASVLRYGCATPSNPSHASGRPSAAFASHRGVGPVSPSGPPSTPSLTVTAPPRTGRLAAASRDRARPWSSMYRTLSLVQPLGRTCLSLWRSEYLNHAHWPQQQAWFGRGGGCATWGVYHTPCLSTRAGRLTLSGVEGCTARIRAILERGLVR